MKKRKIVSYFPYSLPHAELELEGDSMAITNWDTEEMTATNVSAHSV